MQTSAVVARGLSSCGTWAQQLSHVGSAVVARGLSSVAHGLSSCSPQALEYRFNNCGAQA